MKTQKWEIVYTRDGPTISPHEAGLDIRRAMESIRGYYEDRLKFFNEMTPEVFVRYFGYEPDAQMDLFDTELAKCTCADCVRHQGLQ